MIYSKVISNGNRAEWRPFQSIFIRVITKSDDSETRVRFVYHEYDNRPNWTTRNLNIKLIIKITIS